MSGIDIDRLRTLIREDRVHRAVYLDPAIFALEMERIFGRAWIFVGHESQVPKPGDFFATRIGLQPVVMVRHADGKVRVLFNRCGHRGAMVCREEAGNAAFFRCAYHGWTYRTDGALRSVPMRDGYPERMIETDKARGMVEVARTDAYHGFVFASLSADGPDLATYLGPIKSGIDRMVDLAPAGTVSIAGGFYRLEYRGNWKIQLENLNDLYHPAFTHASTIMGGGRQFRRRDTEDAREDQVQIVDQEGRPNSFWDATGVWAYPNGHGYMGRMPIENPDRGPVFETYRQALVARHGEEKTRQVLDVDRHNTIIYPSIAIQTLSQHIRAVYPVAVDRTEIRFFPIRLDGAPPEMARSIVRYFNMSHSPIALVQTDDLEMFRRCQDGLATQGEDWVLFARWAGRNEEMTADGGVHAVGTSEIPMRNQYRAWRHYMCGAA